MTKKTPSQPVFTLSKGDFSCSVQGLVQRDDDGVRLVLKHDYADVKVGPGWTVEGRDFAASVKKVDGRTLTCEE